MLTAPLGVSECRKHVRREAPYALLHGTLYPMLLGAEVLDLPGTITEQRSLTCVCTRTKDRGAILS